MPNALPRTAARHERRTRRFAARLKAVLSTLVVATLATASVVAGAASSTQAATINPLSGASGFSVVSFGDAELSNAEIEGSAAIGGDLSTKSPNPYSIIHKSQGNGDYILPTLNTVPVSLVVGGTFDRANSTNLIRVQPLGSTDPANQAGQIVIGDATNLAVVSESSGVCVRGVSDTSCNGIVLAQPDVAQTPAQAVDPTAFNTVISPADIADLTSVSDQIAAGALESTSTVAVSLTGSSPEFTLDLTANKTNVWTIDSSALPTGQWKIKFGTVKPSATSPLIIRVTAADGATINLPSEVIGSYDAPGSTNDNNFARFMLWNIQQAEGDTITVQSDGIVPGSFLAPHSNFIAAAGTKTLIEGQLVAKTVVLRNGSGEFHHYAFTPLLEFETSTTGSFTIHKALSGPAGLVPGTTQFTVNYQVDGGTAIPLTLLADGTTETVAGLPVGAEVTFTEATPPALAGVTWGTATFSPSTVTIGDGTTVDVTLTNTYTATAVTTGSFTIHKALSGPAGLVPDATEFTVEYEVNGGTPIEITLLADGTAVTVDNLPDGAVITFDEPSYPTTVTGVNWIGKSFSPSTITIDDAAVATVTLTNTYTDSTAPSGSFSIHKELLGLDDAIIPADTEFTVEYTIDGGPAQTLTLLADGTDVTVNGLPVGAEIVFSEPTYPTVAGVNWTLNSFNNETIIIGNGTVADVILTNTYEAASSIRSQAFVNGVANGTINPNSLNVLDMIYYQNLLPGHNYRLEGEIVYLDGTTIVSTGITNSVDFTTGIAGSSGMSRALGLLADGQVESPFTIPASLLPELNGKRIFIFQTLFDGATQVTFDGAASGTDPWFNTTPEWFLATLALTPAAVALTELPHTGVDGAATIWLIAVAALLLGAGFVGAGALRRRRSRAATA